MKSNEEFLAGIYRKAELAQAEQRENVVAVDFHRGRRTTGPAWLRGVYKAAPMVAAAALLLVIGVSQRERILPDATRSTGEITTENGVAEIAAEPDIALISQDEDAAMQSRGVMERHVEAQILSVENTAEGTVISYEAEGESLTFTLTAEQVERINPEVLVPGYTHGLWMTEGEEGWQLTRLEYELAEIVSMIILGK